MSALLMIPGPIELSAGVKATLETPPLSHTDPGLIERFGRALGAMREVWRAEADHQPFVVAGSGTLAMEMAVTNLLDPGQNAVVVDLGVFGERMAHLAEVRGVNVARVTAEVGQSVALDDVASAIERRRPHAVFITHVDTSTGVRVDVPAIAKLAKEAGALVVVDGVCATAAERLDQTAWGIDVALTGSQKAIGAPPGLALLVASPRALEARKRLVTPPPVFMDFERWLPIMTAYAEGRPSYFATPATGLIPGLAVALDEILADGLDEVFTRHAAVARALRRAWDHLGLTLVPPDDVAANTLSALHLPAGVGGDLPAKVAAKGVAIAGGLHPALKGTSIRIGHMGDVTKQPEALRQTVEAVGGALADAGQPGDLTAALQAIREIDITMA
ncbi:MAG: aminotransferase class V-fold PLP-dependent enzyme [Myxococcota bacterium]